MQTFYEIVDTLLKEQRKKRPWLADETGIPLSTINTWFSTTRLPGLDSAFKIAQALNVSVDYLMTGKDPENKYSSPVIKRMVDMMEGKDEVDLIRLEGIVILADALMSTS